jgi:heptosyltransferase-1
MAKMSVTSPLSFQRLAIIRLSSLGDIVHTLPAFQALREHFPRAKISWFAEPAGARLLQNFSGIDEIIVIDLKKKKLGEILKEIGIVRRDYRKQFDLIIDFQGLMKSALLSHLLKCDSIGFHRKNLKEPPAGLFYTYRGEVFDEKKHVILKNLQLLAFFGIDRPAIVYPPVQSMTENRITRFMKDHHLVPGKFIILNIGGGWSSKILDLEQNRELINRLRKKYPVVLLWGNEREKNVAIELSRVTGVYRTEFLHFPELFDFIRQSVLVITADTLAMHVADMFKIPTVGIFGPTDPNRNGSLLSDSRSVFQKTECGFCYKQKCDTMTCLKQIDMNEIENSVKIIYEKYNRSHH